MKRICKSRALSLVLMVVMLFGMLLEYVHAAPANTTPTVNVSTWEELAAAMEEDSTTNIVVTRDIVFNEARTKKHPYDNGVYYNGNDYVVEVKGNHTVDLNGKKVDIRTDKDTSSEYHLYYYEDINRDYYIGRTIYLFHVYDGAAVTMKDSSEKQTGSLRFHAYIEEWDLGEIRGAYASKKDGSYQEYRYSDRDSERVLFSVYNGSLTFESGKYIAGRSKQQWVSWAVKHQEDNIYTGLIDDYHGYAYHLIGGGISASVNSDITVLGGEFEGRRADLFRILGGSLTINDGYFDNRCLGTIIKNVKDAEVNVYGGKFRGGTYDWFLNDEQKSREEVEEGYTTDSQPVAWYVDWELYNVKHNGKTYTNKGDYFHAVEYNSKVKSVITEEVVPKNQTEVSRELSDAVISFIPSGEETLAGSVQSDAISFYPGQKGLIQTNMEEIRYFAADAGAEVTGEWSIRFAKKGTEEQYEEPVSCSVPGDASFELDSYMTVNKAPFKLNEMEPGSRAILQVTLTETLGKVKIVHRGEAEIEVLNEQPLQNAQVNMKDGSGKYGSKLKTGTDLDDYDIYPFQNTIAVKADKWIDMTTKVAAVGEVVNGKRYSKLIAVTAAPGYYLDNTFTLSSHYTDWKIVPIRFDERTRHKVAYYQVIVPTENGPISATNLRLPAAAYQDGHLVPGTVISDLQFRTSVGQTTVEVQFWTENGKEVANSETAKGLHSYKAMLKLTCGAEEIFDPELVVELEGRKCELLGVSENGMEAYVYTPVLTASCEHVGPEWIREETEHWKNCIFCGERFDEDEHAWAVVSSMNNLELWKCSICGAQTRLVKNAVELKKIVVDIPYPTAGEVITPVTIAPQFAGMAKVVTSTWYKGDSKQPVTLGTARFEKGVNYYVTVQVKTEYGYALSAGSEQTVLTNSGVYVKSTDFGSGDQFQIYDADAGNIQAQFHYVAMEKADAELTLPEAKQGMTFEELVKGIKLTNSAGHLVTIRKNGTEDASASVLPLSDTMTIVSFKDGYNNKGTAALQSGNVYTVVTEVTLTNGAILSKNVKIANRGNAANVVITDGVSGPVVMATYALGATTQNIDYVALTVTPPVAGEYPAKAVGSSDDYTVATKWDAANTAFEAGKTYRVQFSLAAAENHKFTEDTIVMVNGKPAESVYLLAEDKLSAAISLSTPAAKKQVIQGYKFTVDEPVAGDSINSHKIQGISKIGSEGEWAAVDSDWSPSVGNFEAGKNYTFSITMRAKENSLFADNAVFSLNGAEQFTVLSGLGTDTVKLEYTFPRLFGITSQPRDINVTIGQKASFTVEAGGEELTYQWQYKTATTNWTSAPGTSKFATYSFTTDMSQNGNVYRCVLTDKNGKSLTTNEAKLTVLPNNLATPVITGVSNAATGVQVKWNAVAGAAKYRVFYKVGSGAWTAVTGDETGTSKTVTGLSSGKEYTFVVRCVSADGKNYTSPYDTSKSKSITYIAQPVLTSVSNTATGVEVKWNAVGGAAKYRVFYRIGSGSWTISAGDDVTGTSKIVTGLTNGTNYTFTVRCVSADGKSYTSTYDATGKSITYNPTTSTALDTPVLTSVSNTATGVQVKWNAVTGAEKYRVFYKAGSGSWTAAAGDETGTSKTVTGLTSGTAYTFVVRCVSADGKNFTSPYDTSKSKSITYIAQPVLTSVSNVANGVEVKWNAVGGAAKYRVFYRIGSGAWTPSAGEDVTGTSKVVTGLTKGTTYIFTVRCVSADGKSYTSTYDATGKSITYNPTTSTALDTPVLTGVSNVATGVQVKWNAVAGAEKYRVFYKTGSGSWTAAAGDETGTSKTVTGLTSGTAYTFVVRCVSADGKTFTSPYDTSKSKSITYIAQPVLTSVSNTANGVEVKWNAVGGAAKYRVFYRIGSGVWTQVAGDETGTSKVVTGLTKGTTYTFTVRCVSADGKNYTSSYDAVGKKITVE